ncbi:MAG TPA: hypothetical protein VH637_06835 [Streptosporangiaceae bacterium]
MNDGQDKRPAALGPVVRGPVARGPVARGPVVRGPVVLSAVLVLVLAGCGSAGPAGQQRPARAQAPAATGPPSAIALPSPTASGLPRPVACTSVTEQGGFASASPDSAVTLDEISEAVGFKVSTSMPDTQSALAFRGYEECRYDFDTPRGGAQEDVALVVGTNPLDTKTAAAEYAITQAQKKPFSERQGFCGGCGYSFTPVPGLGDSAVKGFQNGTDEVVAAVQGDVYVEIGPGQLKEFRMIALAKLILGNVR